MSDRHKHFCHCGAFFICRQESGCRIDYWECDACIGEDLDRIALVKRPAPAQAAMQERSDR